jgi:hypothetical protein
MESIEQKIERLNADVAALKPWSEQHGMTFRPTYLQRLTHAELARMCALYPNMELRRSYKTYSLNGRIDSLYVIMESSREAGLLEQADDRTRLLNIIK